MDVNPRAESMPEGRDVVYVEELAARLGVSKATVRSAIKNGEVKANRIGRRIIIPLPEVQRLLSPAGQVSD